MKVELRISDVALLTLALRKLERYAQDEGMTSMVEWVRETRTVLSPPVSERFEGPTIRQVPSETGNGYWTVTHVNGEYSCTCPDFFYRTQKTECKHIRRVKGAAPAGACPRDWEEARRGR